MNRQERRKQEKNLKKNREAINNMTPTQAKITDLVATERANILANKYIDKFSGALDTCMTAALLDYGIEYGDVEGIQNNMSSLLEEHSVKTEKLEGENINMSEIVNKVQLAIEEVLEKGLGKREAMDELIFKFPSLSKSMLTNAYAKVKKESGYTEDRVAKEDVYAEFQRKSNVLDGKKMIEHAMSKYGFTEKTAMTYYYKWKKEFMAEKETVVTKSIQTIDTATAKELQENAKEIIEKAKERQCIDQAPVTNKMEVVEMKGLKVIEEKIIKTVKVEGKNGTYAADTNKGVILSRENASICFKNEEELNEWVMEFRQVFKMVM